MNNGNKQYELRDDNGNLFLNKKKKSENSPDWSGKMRLNGQEFWLSAWEKKTKNGEVFYSVKLGNMVPAQPTMSQHSIDKGNGYAPADKNDYIDDPIPF
jgi:hypothetical protein